MSDYNIHTEGAGSVGVIARLQANHIGLTAGTDGAGNFYAQDVNVNGMVAARSYIWNTSSLAWEPATGSLTGGGNVTVNNFPATQPISAASLPLPTGASTSALQTSGNSSLTSIDGKVTACNTGAVVISGALPTGGSIVGRVGIDQTTPGTTNKVTLGADNVAVTNANLDVALSTRLKPADTLAGVTTVGAVTGITNALPAGGNIIGKTGIDQTTPGTTNKVSIGTDGTVAVANLDVALSTRLKPADTLTGVTTVGAVTSITNNVNTVEVAPTTVAHAKVTVTTAGTRVQFGANACKSVVVKALASNTGLAYVGGSTVASTNGFQLSAGDTVALDINNTNVIYIDSAVNGEGVTFLSVN